MYRAMHESHQVINNNDSYHGIQNEKQINLSFQNN